MYNFTWKIMLALGALSYKSMLILKLLRYTLRPKIDNEHGLILGRLIAYR